jgi:hypothetical protein
MANHTEHDTDASAAPPVLAAPDADRFRRLRTANVVIGCIHLAQAVAVLLLANGFAIAVTAAFLDGPPGTAPGTPTTLFRVRYGPAVAAFLLLAAVDHLLVASPWVHGWYERQLRQGRNPARWIEYSVSASLMVVLIAMLTGIDDVYAVVAIFGVNSAMILFGLLMERVNPDRTEVDWWPYVFGCVAGVVPWVAITVAIVGSQVESSSGVPGFVFAIFVSLFLLFATFAVNQWLQFRRLGRWRDGLWAEDVYLVLSLTAKSALAWQVFAGALAS